jgi:perosamine synthetase
MKRFTLGSSSIGELEKKYVLEVLNRNFISPGKVVDEVQRKCAEMHSKKHGLATNSGQSAIHLAIQAIVDIR